MPQITLPRASHPAAIAVETCRELVEIRLSTELPARSSPPDLLARARRRVELWHEYVRSAHSSQAADLFAVYLAIAEHGVLVLETSVAERSRPVA